MAGLQLNLDILSEILSRLRAKHLTKLKSVCKTWLRLISSQEFIKLHLKKSTLRAIHLENAYFIPCPRLFPRPDAKYTGQRLLSYPINRVNNPMMVFAGSSCDGLVCLLNQENGIVHIWNPALRSSACIPINKLKDEEKIECFWFGLHENEYKLVVGSASSRFQLIMPYSDNCDQGHKSSMQQESSRKNYQYEEAVGTLFNDNVHWAVVVRSERAPPYLAIVWFDLRSANVGEILLAEVVEGHFRSFKLGEINGCLCYAIWRDDGLHEVWGMNEYGVKDSSWTKVMVLYTDYVRRFCRDELQEVELEDPMRIKSPLYRKQVYVESLVSPTRGACCRSRFCCFG